jgi:hypothetical protein
MAEQIATLNYFDRCIHMVSIDDVLALFWPPPIAKEKSAEQFSTLLKVTSLIVTVLP